MTLYVFDTSSFIVLENYYPKQFRTLWSDVDALVDVGRVLSVSEVRKELDNEMTKSYLADWINSHSEIFDTPSSDEMAFVRKIFAVPAFQALVKQKNRLKGSPVADPFVIARAAVRGGCVVSEESPTSKAIRIPNVCDHFGVEHSNLEGLMAREGWQY